MKKRVERLFLDKNINALKNIGFYNLLGVSKELKGESFKIVLDASYCWLACRYGSENANGSEAKAEIFKLVTEAYTVLKNDKKRAAYDRYVLSDDENSSFEELPVPENYEHDLENQLAEFRAKFSK